MAAVFGGPAQTGLVTVLGLQQQLVQSEPVTSAQQAKRAEVAFELRPGDLPRMGQTDAALLAVANGELYQVC